ncbi:Rha family transcriptional regulator [Stenotrophomonas sp. STM01]|uniref:Rha family transcriptional regulator n=1 Tax=Stenotrophomonas sp. STM01 TaxID=2769278 RepID=UPI00177B61D0|nr:Rha family transcriptional regulator [Stenotrophomonas sp. STM01]MBD9534634.1 Rha family transcriptional regulator [Stenotrophomonas sp. STM01]
MSDLVMLAGGQAITDSQIVALQFGKRHRNVLQAIRNLGCSERFRALNFQQCLKINELANGKPEPVVQMTKDGFLFLVMGFTGERAAAMKESFIDAFNRMAEFIQTQALAKFENWEAARLDYQSDQEHVSRCGKDLSNWKSVKPRHLARLEELNPQIKLPLDDDSEED